MPTVHVAHTADLDSGTLAAARRLLDEVFAPDMTEEDWEHCLGGLHTLVRDGGELVGHAAIVQRRLLHGGRALRTGYVEGVAVRADRQREGIGSAMLAELVRIARGAYELAALGSTDTAVPFYTAHGWQPWRGRTYALTPDGIRRTAEEDDGIYVLPLAVPVDVSGELVADWREGDVW
ncbi:GNAT family N-acetyltransferase [Streptomyces sp. NRRL B-24484]|uniref:GNAT family N-acetyltransferase n=1 Tax=Streptomyces sp. NRRL B-24484 TaxID=1463833 RepID=UPI0004BF1802|nr:GNAT family N-acetyltransferase [Streptomyces sp. NRRL B-24484]